MDIRLRLLLLLTLTRIVLVHAGNCFSTYRPDPDDQDPPPKRYLDCKNRRPPGNATWAPDGGWACARSDINFPTVGCLAADMQACGNVGQNSVFYSFGAATVQVVPFRDKLVPRGIMFNDILDEAYYKEVIEKGLPIWRLDDRTRGTKGLLNENMTRDNIYVARVSQAFAQLSTGVAYLVVKDINGKPETNDVNGQRTRPGAYQKPPIPDEQEQYTPPNIWRAYEFPTLQRNAKILQVVAVDLGNADAEAGDEPPYTQYVNWPSNDPASPNNLLPLVNADDIPLPDPNPQPRYMHRRDDPDACTPGSTASVVAPSPTAPPASTLSCEHQDETAEIESEYCLCQGSITLPVITTTSLSINEPSSSCAYTSLPASTAIVTPTVKVPNREVTTDTALCQVCTPIAINEDDCTSMTSCVPHAPSAYVEAGSSPVHVGTLTSTALSSSISSALEKLCPTVTQTTEMTRCSDEAVKVDKIPYKNPADDLLDHGDLEIRVQASQYNATSLRDAMIISAAITAMQSATGDNCYIEEYDVEGPVKRSVPSTVGRYFSLTARDHVTQTQESMSMCKAISFAGVHYLPEYWRQSKDPESTEMYIDAAWEFKTPSGSELACDFIGEAIDLLSVIAPEFTIADVELSEAITVACTLAMEKAEQ
ncbi:MAG: hypothetical protein L6R39_000557 [Caloplaca ligustica]|nr:MAG: hypothetical protein L6R39_000557 [Caloplaca ligustica]